MKGKARNYRTPEMQRLGKNTKIANFTILKLLTFKIKVFWQRGFLKKYKDF